MERSRQQRPSICRDHRARQVLVLYAVQVGLDNIHYLTNCPGRRPLHEALQRLAPPLGGYACPKLSFDPTRTNKVDPDWLQIQREPTSQALKTRPEAIDHCPSGGRSLGHHASGKGDGAGRAARPEILGRQFSNESRCKEPDHARLLDLGQRDVLERERGQRVSGRVHNVVQPARLLKQLLDLLFQRCLVTHVGCMSRHSPGG